MEKSPLAPPYWHLPHLAEGSIGVPDALQSMTLHPVSCSK